jgi:hypothetical protein
MARVAFRIGSVTRVVRCATPLKQQDFAEFRARHLPVFAPA